MALPVSLRNSITPPELELVASEELVEIIPLISMERTAFISVRPDSPIVVLSILNTVIREHTAPYARRIRRKCLCGLP
jgi:hypothetical protein